ncbi:glycosyltransferase [uncultured Bacteroides sp.]|uniref:glycosyltransferase n=1 Tax=uncultured Bacteroides sp. TaxID=162156 RepID=UPI002AAAC6FA|nr:glycosyltransferase [uncultured Bacteroides sp.]
MNPTLSIIVPVYKVEEYIHKCITSILNQTFTDFELILIDDGSPDNCGAICDDYAKIDNRIIVIHQKNQGLSGARNAGLNIAKGDYITFVDSDDSIATNTYYDNIEILLNDNSIDVLEYPYQKVYNHEQELMTDPTCHIYRKKEIFLYWTLHSNKMHVVWNKIYKRNIFNNIRFPYGKIHEDSYLLPDISENVSHLYVSEKGMYFYLIRESSISFGDTFSRKRPFKDQLDHYDSWLKVNEKIKYYNAYNNKLILGYNRYISTFINTEIDHPENDFYEYESRFEKLNFNIKQIMQSQLANTEKLKLILIKTIGLKKIIIIYKFLKSNRLSSPR